jgi:hypothetical protein
MHIFARNFPTTHNFQICVYICGGQEGGLEGGEV